MGTGKGYLTAYGTNNNGEFYGELHTAPVVLNLSYTPTAGNGWNLLGNPFSSPIDWDLLTKSIDVNGAVYVLRGSDNTYVSWNGSTGDLTDGIIPVCNGFFVKTTSTGQTIEINPEDQVHESNVFLKHREKEMAKHSLKLTIENGEISNNTYIQFREDATATFDNAIDAYKLFGTSSGPQLFTRISGVDYAINCLPLQFERLKLILGFISGQDTG